MSTAVEHSRYFDIPRYFYFEVGNTTVGSMNTFNYKVSPKGEEFIAKVWYGEKCSDESEAEAEQSFAFNADGYGSMLSWVDEQFEIYKTKLRDGEVKGRRTFIGSL